MKSKYWVPKVCTFVDYNKLYVLQLKRFIYKVQLVSLLLGTFVPGYSSEHSRLIKWKKAYPRPGLTCKTPRWSWSVRRSIVQKCCFEKYGVARCRNCCFCLQCNVSCPEIQHQTGTHSRPLRMGVKPLIDPMDQSDPCWRKEKIPSTHIFIYIHQYNNQIIQMHFLIQIKTQFHRKVVLLQVFRDGYGNYVASSQVLIIYKC